MQAFTKGHPNGSADDLGNGFRCYRRIWPSVLYEYVSCAEPMATRVGRKFHFFLQTKEYRQAIAFMAKMYSGGLFYPGSLTQSGILSTQNFMAGKYGSYLGSLH